MRNITPRAICLHILSQVEKADRHPDNLLSDSFKRYRHLTLLDRSFLTELTYGILRWRGKLDWVIRHFSKIPLEKIEPDILNTLRLGCYQILILSKIPHAAAVNESVELAKQGRGKGGASFVNAILRALIRKKGEVRYPDIQQDPALHIAVVNSHPLWLVHRWIDEMGIEETIRVCTFNNQMSTLTLRTNTLKMDRTRLLELLREEGLNPFPTPFSEEGIWVKEAPPTSELPLSHKGLYRIQDEASQLVTSILNPQPGECILDGCAAPGGKTSHIAQRMENRGEIYALDLNRKKLNWIGKGCDQLGITIVKTVRGDASKPLPIPEGVEFDRVLVDVPCSGFGTIRKNPDVKWRKNEEDILRLSGVQHSILKNLSRYVKEGGQLVYSTCTVFHEENEDVVVKFLNEHPNFHLDPPEQTLLMKWRPIIEKDFIKTFPPKDQMDGFFIARMVKTR